MEGCRISSKETSEKKQTSRKFVDWLKYALPLRQWGDPEPLCKMTYKSEYVLQLLKVSRNLTRQDIREVLIPWNILELAFLAIPLYHLTHSYQDWWNFPSRCFESVPSCHPRCYHLVPLHLCHIGLGMQLCLQSGPPPHLPRSLNHCQHYPP